MPLLVEKSISLWYQTDEERSNFSNSIIAHFRTFGSVSTFTSDFYKLVKAKDRLTKAALKSKSNYLMASYSHIREKVNSLNTRLKKGYYCSKIQETISNIKKT